MTRLEKAERVLELIHYKNDAIDRIAASVSGVYLPDDQLSDADLEQKYAVIQTTREVAEQSVHKVMRTVAEVYAQYYEEDELERMIVWYESDLGKKILAESDRSFSEIETVMGEWGTQLWNVVRVRMGW